MLRRASAVVAALALTLVAACSEPAPPISVGEGMVTLVNQTGQDWKDVLITVNDHYRGFVPVLKAEGRANAPLNQFSTGHGVRWTSGTYVKTVDVTAKNADGTDVKLAWGRDEKKR